MLIHGEDKLRTRFNTLLMDSHQHSDIGPSRPYASPCAQLGSIGALWSAQNSVGRRRVICKEQMG